MGNDKSGDVKADKLWQIYLSLRDGGEEILPITSTPSVNNAAQDSSKASIQNWMQDKQWRLNIDTL